MLQWILLLRTTEDEQVDKLHMVFVKVLHWGVVQIQIKNWIVRLVWSIIDARTITTTHCQCLSAHLKSGLQVLLSLKVIGYVDIDSYY